MSKSGEECTLDRNPRKLIKYNFSPYILVVERTVILYESGLGPVQESGVYEWVGARQRH